MDEPDERGDTARLWALAQALARAADGVRGGLQSRVPPLLLFTDPQRTPRPWDVAARMPPGSGVVYRTFGAADAREGARRLRAITAERGMTLLIGRDPDLADWAGADGLHLPERSLSAAYALSGRRPDWILTGAVHSVEAARSARGLDAVVLSPIFLAGGASARQEALGPAVLNGGTVGAARVLALGGVTARNAEKLRGSPFYGIAAIGGITAAVGA